MRAARFVLLSMAILGVILATSASAALPGVPTGLR